MYYAQMYDYGTDPIHVGVTGMVGCLGAIFAAPHHLYSIHIPPHDNATNLLGANAFVAMVQGGEGAAHPAGSLHVFVNGTIRDTADAEARNMVDPLGVAFGLVYRLMTGLDPPVPGNPLAASIKAQMVAGILQLGYKHVPDDNWIQGGNARTGRYRGTLADDPTCPNAAELAAAWNPMTAATCRIRRVNRTV
jgi:hypothetical protein